MQPVPPVSSVGRTDDHHDDFRCLLFGRKVNEALGTIGYVSRDVADPLVSTLASPSLSRAKQASGHLSAGLLAPFKACGYVMRFSAGVPIDMILSSLQSVIALLIAAPSARALALPPPAGSGKALAAQFAALAQTPASATAQSPSFQSKPAPPRLLQLNG